MSIINKHGHNSTTGDIMSMNDSWREWISVLFNRVATGAAIIVHVLLKDSFRAHITVGLAFPRKLGSEQSWLKQLKFNWPDLARVTRWPEACSRVLVIGKFHWETSSLWIATSMSGKVLNLYQLEAVTCCLPNCELLETRHQVRCSCCSKECHWTRLGRKAGWTASSKWNDTRFTTNSRAGTLEPWAMLLPCNSRVSCGWDFNDICSHLNMSMGLSFMYIYCI